MMNCPICLLNLVEEKKYASSQPEFLYYVFCSECGNIIGCSAETGKLVEVCDMAANADAARAYITNDVFEENITEELPVLQATPADEFYTMLDEQPEEEVVVPLLQLELEEMEQEIAELEAKVEDDRIREVPDDIHHQLEAEAFGDYLIIINDYKEADFELFTGSKQELNEHLKALNLHNAPKVYALKQIPVHTTYSI
jgi:hypothetical protein